MKKENTVYFDYSVVEHAKKRAETVGIDYSDILKNSGLQAQMMGGARRSYGAHARLMLLDPGANIGLLEEEKYTKYCMAFMLDPKKFIVENPPKVETKQENVVPESNDELLSVLEELTQEMKTHRHEMIKLRDALKAFGESTTLTKVAKNTEETNMKLLTTNRALDAIDNKVNTLVSHGQKVEQKLDKGNNAALETANKLKAVVEGVSGLLSKVTKICALYDRR